MASCKSYAQDSITLYDKIYNQIKPVRALNNSYYYNPANMLDYSNISFIDIQLNYQKQSKDNYLLQEGKSINQTKFKTSSFTKQKNNQTIWGKALYNHEIIKDATWNNNLDLERISPIVMADSVGGKTTVQHYQFTGGYNKKINRFAWGIQLDYNAALSYKTKDPRPKNVVSDLIITAGSNYNILNNYTIGLFGSLNRYIQTSTISFSSEVERATIYQMNGLGNYNFYFSSRSNRSVYVDFKTTYGLTFGSKNNDFSVVIRKSDSNLDKETFIDSGTSSYQINRLSNDNYFTSVFKNFKISDRFILGGKINFETHKKVGTEIFYTNNTEILQTLFEKENYQFKYSELIAQLNINIINKNSNVSLLPYYRQTKYTEKRLDNNTFLSFNKHIFGTEIQYIQRLTLKNTINFHATLFAAKNSDKISNIDNTNVTIINWLNNDFEYKTLNYNAFKTMLRYDHSFNTKQSIYSIFALDLYKFSDNKTNTNFGITFGLTF